MFVLFWAVSAAVDVRLQTVTQSFSKLQGWVATLAVVFLLAPAVAGAQTRVRLFVEGGPAADVNDSPFSVSGIGAAIGAGVLVTPTVSVGFNAEWVELRFNEASWSSYAVTVGKMASLTERVTVRGSVGVGVVRSQEFRIQQSSRAITVEGSLPIRLTTQLSIGPQIRFRNEFDDEYSGLVTVLGVGVRWQQRR